jgi:hypothetical protein
LESSMKTIPICHAALRWPHATHFQAGGKDCSDGNRPGDEFATFPLRH